MPKNMMVGAFDFADFKEDTLQLDHGDTLVMFTDGVTEAMDPSFKVYGEDRLNALLNGLAGKSSQEIIEAIKADITEHVDGAEQSDDITMLVLKRK